MKKQFKIFLALLLLLGLVACGATTNQPEETGGYGPPQFEYIEEISNTDVLFQYASNLVQASLVSVEDFNGAVCVYLFDIETDYTGNTPDQIHMYDALDEQYIVGHSYYLALEGHDSALYPHTIYTSVYKELILDITANGQGEVPLAGGETSVCIQDMEDLMLDAVSRGIVGEKMSAPIEVSDINSVARVSEEADLILEVAVSGEHPMNRYVSIYQLELISILKGPEDYEVSIMNLPPNLDPDETYYIFLDRLPDDEDDYALSSRQLPVVPVTEEATQSLSLD